MLISLRIIHKAKLLELEELFQGVIYMLGPKPSNHTLNKE